MKRWLRLLESQLSWKQRGPQDRESHPSPEDPPRPERSPQPQVQQLEFWCSSLTSPGKNRAKNLGTVGKSKAPQDSPGPWRWSQLAGQIATEEARCPRARSQLPSELSAPPAPRPALASFPANAWHLGLQNIVLQCFYRKKKYPSCSASRAPNSEMQLMLQGFPGIR